MNHPQVPDTENPENINFAFSLVESLHEPVLVIDGEGTIMAANSGFFSSFSFRREEIGGQRIFDFYEGLWNQPQLENFVAQLKVSGLAIRDFFLLLRSAKGEEVPVNVNGNKLALPREGAELYLLSFKIAPETGREITYRKLLNEILSEAPAFICIVRGPEHVFELANDNYLQLMAYRDIIGRTVKEALPEVENQGFIEMLDSVYKTGKPYIGKETAIDLHQRDNTIKKSLLDFVYQPIRNASGQVNGIFVHAIDVTEKVHNRKKLEDSERELRNWIDTVPVMIWLTNEMGEDYYLNKTWYDYTGQTGKETGDQWLDLIHPGDREHANKVFTESHDMRGEFEVTYRMRNKSGEYRWMLDRGAPKYSPEGKFQGFIGSVTDVHEDKLKEQVIKEKELRTRSIVEEATVATALYMGEDMVIEMANDAMLKVWGKDRSIIGKTLREALPELEGQPFLDLLQIVYTSGETYWGEEDRVDLMHNGEITTGFFNFTYKPLRDGKGEIYGILNMALDVTEMVRSRNLLKEREKHFRLLSDLMPEKVMNTNAEGEATYFNKNWLDYSGLSSQTLKDPQWQELIHPEDHKKFWPMWQKSLKTGSGLETEVRLKNRSGKYLWHLTRAEAAKDEEGQIKMWICTSTEIQRLKEEEKRKGDFLKMVSHELKTPVTSIKGYVQLLLNMLKPVQEEIPAAIPLQPSLERIDNQIVRLTRLISEMLDLSRLEDNKLELKKEDFSINELVEQTVQDINLTNTQHQIEIFHEKQAEVHADRDRIGQVLINFITNAIKYSPESRYIGIHIFDAGEGQVAVSVRDRGIGIEAKYHKNIFKRFYRIGGLSEDTYSGFGIGLYLANEIMERHNGSIEVRSKKGQGSDFCFKLFAISNEN